MNDSFLFSEKLNDKGRAFAFFAFKIYAAVGNLNDVVDHGKSQARSTAFRGEIRQENLLLVFLLNAFSVVAYRNDVFLLIINQFHINFSIGFAVDGLHGILNDVAKSAVQIGLVAIKQMLLFRIVFIVENYVFLHIIQIHYTLQQRSQIKRFGMIFGQFGKR